MLKYRPFLKPIARRLRYNMTDSEQLLWRHLRAKQIKEIQFYRQKPLGPYIVDFYCPSAKLVIEVDGSQHMDPIQLEQDAVRDVYLSAMGLCVLRFNNLQIQFEIEGVMETIHHAVDAITQDSSL